MAPINASRRDIKDLLHRSFVGNQLSIDLLEGQPIFPSLKSN